jgi:Uma2 family endonuclease
MPYAPRIEREFEDDILLHLPDGGRGYEWVDGHIRYVAEPDRLHGYVGLKLGARLLEYVEANDLGAVFGLDSLFLLKREPRQVRGPDVAFVAKRRMPERLTGGGVWAIAPDLAAEVLSPSQSAKRMQPKVDLYLEAGARLVWIVDPRKHTVTIHRAGRPPRTLTATDVLDGEDVVPGFRCLIASILP